MKKWAYIIAVIALLVAIGDFSWALMQHDLWQLAPIFAYDRPHGVMGWSLAVAIVAAIIGKNSGNVRTK